MYRNTPKEAKTIVIKADDRTQYYEDELYDLIFVEAMVTDTKINRIPNYSEEVKFVVSEGVEVVGDPIVRCEAGIASTLVKVQKGTKEWTIKVQSEDLKMEVSKTFTDENK